MSDQLATFDEIVHEVTIAGNKLYSNYLAMHLLMSLPKSYKTIVPMITHNKVTLNLYEVKFTILADWSKHNYVFLW